MYIVDDYERFYINRVYWFHSGGYAIYEFINKYGDILDFEVKVDETINEKVKLYFE